MKFISPSSRSLTRDAIRVVNPRRLLLPGLALLLLCNLGAFAGGVWLGQGLGSAQAPARAGVAKVKPAEESFALARLGELVGRLRSLEADALQLRRMLVEHKALSEQVSALDPALLPELAPSIPAGGRGGVLLPPRGCAAARLDTDAQSLEALGRSETTARCLRGALDHLLERVANRNAALMAIPSHRPVQGARLGSAFGNRVDPFNKRLAFHSGLDFSIAGGTAVVAAAGGRVMSAQRHGGYGKLLEIDHGNGLVTRYAHLSRFYVKAGDVVTPGQRVAAVGSTGRSTGPHLHFEVRHHGRFVDPQRFLALADLPHDSDLAHD
ncbi:M23 family metallopeptidase [Pseudomonas sp. CAU 1711]|uniref:M23 family metallopeptidase n=1 Tax=Pseudomonas sp. CAU 1711 TaxID=3140356 RepID=UPI003260E3FA